MEKVLFVSNLVFAGFLTGLIWYVQIAQYPLFSSVGKNEFVEYHARHSNLTTIVVILPMLFELGTSALLLLYRPVEFALWAAIAGLVLNIIIWVATGFVSVPLHNKLDILGYNIEVIQQLVATNWIRTIAWTTRLGLLIFFLFKLLK